MANDFSGAENNVDAEIQRKREVKLLENAIRYLTEQKKKNGLTSEQEFLMQYYDLDEETAKKEKINISNAERLTHIIPENKRGQIETTRYNILMELFEAFEEFDPVKINDFNDRFHSDITDWEEYKKDFDNEPMMIKKMRNMQMLNRMAHEYTTIFRKILYAKNPQLEKYSSDQLKIIENHINNLFTGTRAEKIASKKELTKQFGAKKINKWENDNAIKHCMLAKEWMFKQKHKYLINVLEELREDDKGYNYGILDDAMIFDVPKYGQFGIHLGRGIKGKIQKIKSLGVKEYKGEHLGDVYILSKANPELIQNVNYDELSESDKQRYRIVSQEIKEDIEIKENVNIETMIKNAKNPEKAQEIVDIIKEAGLPEEVVNKTVIDRGNPKAIRDIIDIIKNNDYGIDLDIISRSKTLLAVGEEKAIDIMEIFDKINELGLNVKDIITERPTILTVSRSGKLETIYNTLKQYNIDLTNKNIAMSFLGTSENIKRNMDLIIENGLYDFAKTGVERFFTTGNENLNMRINLLKDHNETLTEGEGNKRRINGNLFLKKQDLMKKYGISSAQVLEELSKIRGQELIKDSKYYGEEENEPQTLSSEQQEISNNIYEKLKSFQTEENLVIKIGDYNYSAIKVKEQIDGIIANSDIQNLENEDVNEIIKIALFKNKNITQQEIDEVSEQIQNLDKEEIVQKDIEEESPSQEEPSEEIEKTSSQEEQSEEELEETPSQEEPDQEGLEETPNQEESSKEELEETQNKEEAKDGMTGTQNEEEAKEETENIKYANIKKMTEEIKEKEQNIESMGRIIEELKNVRKTLKGKIAETEEKINQKILSNEDSKEEIIKDIKKLRQIIQKQQEKRKEAKQMIKTYKKHKKIATYTLQQQKEARDKAIDEIEL